MTGSSDEPISAEASSRPKNSDAERARLRRNQRNSRARRAAYVVDVQREARRVHVENKVLRRLLQEYGVSEQSIDKAVKTAIDKISGDKALKNSNESQNLQGIAAKPGHSNAQLSKQEATQRSEASDPPWDLQKRLKAISAFSNASNAESANSDSSQQQKPDRPAGILDIVAMTLPGLSSNAWEEDSSGGFGLGNRSSGFIVDDVEN